MKLSYSPLPPPQNTEALAKYLHTELVNLGSFLNSITDVPTYYEEPNSPNEGQLAIAAVGSTWATALGGGAGLYIYKATTWTLVV